MHLSTHMWMRAERLETTLRRAERLGHASTEIGGEPAQYVAADARAPLGEYGVPCRAAVTLTPGRRNLARAGEAQRARTIAYMQKSAETLLPLIG